MQKSSGAEDAARR